MSACSSVYFFLTYAYIYFEMFKLFQKLLSQHWLERVIELNSFIYFCNWVFCIKYIFLNG